MLLTKTDPHSHPRCINCAAMLGWSRQAVRTRFKLMVSSRHARSFPPNGHPPFKENRKLSNFLTYTLLRCIWKECILSPLLRISLFPTKPPPVEVKDQSSHSTIARSYSKLSPVGCFHVFSGKDVPKTLQESKDLVELLVWLNFYKFSKSNKTTTLATCVATVEGNQPGKMHSWRCCSWRCFESPGNEKPEQLDTSVTRELWNILNIPGISVKSRGIKFEYGWEYTILIYIYT